ncbi:polyprenyl synthetase family protein [Isachenkonia alkalipeptolytica]|uniref:Farnesyl diphosphate synthase n=1 Tax=Isachenkonia alkalipeptolytica TaxID=2565777 RepID=A0AA44BEB5_9CLOT|nr:farnesyl diphosphate synthase [Isachenkonia alkalipeptolytica]NBG88782.1 polyprenyl synthetase family protein [Isachenkonia alkalipeptolytica]
MKETLKEYNELVDEELKKYLKVQDENSRIVYEAMQYSIFAGGKRLRPVLLMATHELFNDKHSEALPFAAAIEMIHTYSLIHDDLPAMDNDDYRRGKLTNHKVFGEGIAILAGDGLLNKAYELLLTEIVEAQDPTLPAKAAKTIGDAAGVKGMIGGQVADIISENQEISAKDLDYIHAHKTGALIEAAMVSGAIISGAQPKDIANIRRVGKNLGLAFQIKDDILDIIGDEKQLGKQIGSDEAKEKSTYPKLYGLDACKKMIQELTEESNEILDYYLPKSDFLKKLNNYLMDREN